MVEHSLSIVPTPKAADENIVAHFSDGKEMTFAKDETIIDGLNEPSGVYLIKEGFVKAHSVSDAGHGNLLLIHKAGEFIPLPWSLDGPHITGLYYQALGNVTLLRVSKDKLRRTMGSNAWLSQEVMNQAINIIAVYTKRIQTLEFRTARGKVIAELINLAERFGVRSGDGLLINAPITHQDIADSVNITRETASRALAVLVDEKLLGQENHMLCIYDLKKLRAELR